MLLDEDEDPDADLGAAEEDGDGDTQPDLPEVAPPPEAPAELLAWAEAHHVSARLDDVIFADDGLAGTYLPARGGETLTYRQVLIAGGRRRGSRWSGYYDDTWETARRYLHDIATIVAARRAARAYLDAHGREPEDGSLAALLTRLRAALAALDAEPSVPRLPLGTYAPTQVRVLRRPAPLLVYGERTLRELRWSSRVPTAPALALVGWSEAEELQWRRVRRDAVTGEDVSADERRRAIEAFVDFLRDPRLADEQRVAAELLRLPPWQHALDMLDENLGRLAPASGARSAPGAAPAPATARAQERLAFRVTLRTDDGYDVRVEPLVQKRGRDGRFSRGARIEWHQIPGRRAEILTAADRRAYHAYEDVFARGPWSASPTWAQVFGVLRALIDHPAVTLAGQRDGDRLEIRHGRLRLRFADAGSGALAPHFDLLGCALAPAQAALALRDDRHLIYVYRPDGTPEAPEARIGAPRRPQVLLSRLEPGAVALVRALASAPARFPAEAHDALATRLEALQETLDVEFPSQWTRTIAPADGRIVVWLQLLASGALEVRLGVRPVPLGSLWPPGEGPTLVLEGQGDGRHGVRRDRPRERQAALALAETLQLTGEPGEASDPWCWRVEPGDPALHVVATLKELEDGTQVEWADDQRLLSMGSVGRGDMRMKVADRRDWFAVEGGARVGDEVVPLSELFAAIREGRRYVAVGARGFARIEETLRAALVHAEAALFERHAAVQVPVVAADPLFSLVEDEAQIEATEAFLAVRRRMREGAAERPVLPPPLDTALRPYQRGGVDWMARLAYWGAGAILADEMGLGKTVQTLALLVHRAARGPALVVAPTSVVPNWLAEAARFAPGLTVKPYRGPGRAAVLGGLGPGDVLVTSYALASLDAEALAGLQLGTLVVDEAQAIKNAGTDRSKALRGLRAEWRLGLTGTPVENHVGELWSIMRVVSPGLLGSWEQFRHRYAVPIEKFGDAARRQALATLLRPFVLRRTKDEVAPELPARTEIARSVRLSEEEEKLYEELRQSFIAEMEARKRDPDRDASDMRFMLLAALTRMRQLCCHPRLVYPRTPVGSSKEAYLVELLGELREGGHKALVFSQFRSFLELLAPRLRQHGLRVLVLDGTTPAEARAERIAAFQSGAADVFLISLKAGGFGLNLTAADTVIHLDPWWNPAVEDQATARAHRIGQQKPVTAIRLVARGTIEEAVLGLHADKRALAAALLDGADVAASLSTEDLVSLIRDTQPQS
jgi:superfamily II DNA or RNA helicase